MAVDMRVNPGEWNEFAGLWFRVQPDPLAGPKHYVVTVHRTPTALWFEVSRPNGGVRVQTAAPDFADLDGGSL